MESGVCCSSRWPVARWWDRQTAMEGRIRKTTTVGGIGIVIRDGWREVGLGRLLMERILEWMRAQGLEKAELAVFATNVRARRLYESLGFVEEGVRRGHVRIRGAYVDEVLMGLWLKR